MLSWFDKMEKKVGRYAISNLTLYLLIAYGIGYMTRFLMPELLQWLTLEPGINTERADLENCFVDFCSSG